MMASSPFCERGCEMAKNERGWYVVRRPDEEVQCDHCGYPLYVGDRAVEDDRMNRVYCSEKCSERARCRRPSDITGSPSP